MLPLEKGGPSGRMPHTKIEQILQTDRNPEKQDYMKLGELSLAHESKFPRTEGAIVSDQNDRDQATGCLSAK